MTTNPPQDGRFVWYELATPDKAAAQEFYRQLFDWNIHVEDMGLQQGQYPMFGPGQAWQGGMVTPQAGEPAHWMVYVTVPDVDVATTRVPALGGKVLAGPTDIPNVGRFSVVEDPSGAVILPFAFAHDAPPETPHPAPPGHFCWNELLTDRPKECAGFYTDLFGWGVETSEMPDTGTYWVFQRGERMECGMLAFPEQAAGHAPPHWLPYVAVADVDATVELAGELGARVYCQPTDIPQMGRFAVLADPQGAAFAVFENAG